MSEEAKKMVQLLGEINEGIKALNAKEGGTAKTGPEKQLKARVVGVIPPKEEGWAWAVQTDAFKATTWDGALARLAQGHEGEMGTFTIKIAEKNGRTYHNLYGVTFESDANEDLGF